MSKRQPDYSGIDVTVSTREKLNSLKKDGETYDDVINRILDMEDQYNPVKLDITREYEYHYKESRKLFRIHFFEEKYTLTFYDDISHEYKENIDAWNAPADMINNFIIFITKESSIILLLDLEDMVNFGDYCIKAIS